MNESSKDMIIKLNKEFYDALGEGRMDLMEKIWLNDGTVQCVHPGWPLLSGWDAVKESFQDIMNSGKIVGIVTSNVEMFSSDNVVWVSCIENINLKMNGSIETVQAQATNIFELRGDHWVMVLHHTSAIPTPFSDPEKLQ